MEKYVFRKYQKQYRKLFELERKRLSKALVERARVEHVGSTAVPGLGGKGILDIMIGVPKKEFEAYTNKLARAGYEFREKASTKGRLFFRRDYRTIEGKRRIHIHMTPIGSRDWRETIAFRDYLKAHPKEMETYAKIKQKAVKTAKGEGEIYRKHKCDFIIKITKKALKRKPS